MLSSIRSKRRFILASVKFLSRALTALNFDPSMAIRARCKPIWGTRTSNILSAIQNCHQRGSKTFGGRITLPESERPLNIERGPEPTPRTSAEGQKSTQFKGARIADRGGPAARQDRTG